HICGSRELIPFISQKALDLDMQGLMIEAHIDPTVAWTDAKQQVTPAALSEIIDGFILRKAESKNPEFTDKLAGLREKIDKIDDQIFQKLAERMKVVEQIGEFKRDNDVTILQVSRWDEILQKRVSYGSVLNLDKDFSAKILE